jgi:hypothetical protein
MKVFLILYVGTKIGGVWGPLPYDMQECKRRAIERQNAVATMISTGKSEDGTKILPADVIADIRTWSVKCEIRYERPSLSE